MAETSDPDGDVTIPCPSCQGTGQISVGLRRVPLATHGDLRDNWLGSFLGVLQGRMPRAKLEAKYT
jgi:hypothetical protein